MDLQNWHLPVFDGTIQPNVKFHYFIDNKSLCGRYEHDTEFFHTSMLDCGTTFSLNQVCKHCLRKYQKGRN